MRLLERFRKWRPALRTRVESALARTRPAPGESGRVLDLTWVDAFIQSIRPYVFVRTEDSILIKRPNQATRLNDAGAALLDRLFQGMSIHAWLDRAGRTPERVRDVACFLEDVKRWMEGTLDAAHRTLATEVVPFDHRFSELPVLSEVAVTERCNLRCSFCYAGCGGPAAGRNRATGGRAGLGPEMTADQIKVVLGKIFRDARVPSVSFTGGEPTLRPELPALVRHAVDLGLRVNLITNGTRITGALAGALADAGLASAQVSLEGVSAAVHERVTGVAGSFALTLGGVRHLADAGLRVHTNTTINRDNLAECEAFPAFVRNTLGLERFSMNLIIPAGRAAEDDRLAVRYAEIGPHLEAIQAAAGREGVEFMWYSPTPMCLFNPIPRGLGNKGCAACDGLLSVSARGDVLPCSSWNEPVGNLLQDAATDVWRSACASRYRSKSFAHPLCRTCEHFSLCHGACPLYWQQRGYGELARAHAALGAQEGAPIP